MIKFGPSGNSESFYEEGFKSSLDMPEWLKKKGLTAYEYQCNKGVKIGEETAKKLGAKAKENDITLSIHAPYYISMASEEEEKRVNSKRYIIESLTAAKWMGAKRIVAHTGAYSKVDKVWAVEMAIKILGEVIKEADELGLGEIGISPEVLGKQNQMGSLEEILQMCKIDERLIPTVDFGHIHARGLGCLNSKEDFKKVLDSIENELGFERLKNLHIHFSRIEFTKGGEKKHWTLADTQFGPEFSYLAELIYERNLEPIIICESKEYMAEDALKLKKIYEDIANAGGK